MQIKITVPGKEASELQAIAERFMPNQEKLLKKALSAGLPEVCPKTGTRLADICNQYRKVLNSTHLTFGKRGGTIVQRAPSKGSVGKMHACVARIVNYELVKGLRHMGIRHKNFFE